MPNHYRKSRVLPLFFLAIFCLCGMIFTAHAEADDLAPVLPEFVAENPPHEMPDLVFHDANGTTHKLSDFRGQLVLVNLWATWCIPCRRELPSLDRLQRVFRKTKFVILPLSLDDKDDANKITQFFKAQDIRSLTIYKDVDLELLKKLHPDGLPMSYLITPDGKLLGHLEGYAHWDSEEAANLIEAYLPKDSAPARK